MQEQEYKIETLVIKADVSNEDTKKYNENKSRYLNILKIIKKEYKV